VAGTNVPELQRARSNNAKVMGAIVRYQYIGVGPVSFFLPLFSMEVVNGPISLWVGFTLWDLVKVLVDAVGRFQLWLKIFSNVFFALGMFIAQCSL
jgi:hypothetical protein